MSATNELKVSELAVLTPMDMLNRAVSQGANIEVLEKLMALQERWEKNQARKAFDEAVSVAKAKIEPIAKNRLGHNSKRYADFAAIARAIDPVIASQGLSYRFRTTQDERIHVTCVLSHRAGHSEETTLSGPADKTGSKNDIQAIGSTLTYLQRYSLVQMLGLAAAGDDDGYKSEDFPTIDANQAQHLRDLMARTKASEAKFLKWAKVENIEDIRSDLYDSCVDAIKNVKAKS
jgi:hypothetical protein